MIYYSQLVNKLINSLRCPGNWTAGALDSVAFRSPCFFYRQKIRSFFLLFLFIETDIIKICHQFCVFV